MDEEKPFILNLVDFSDRIKRSRQSQKMNQKQLAQKAGLTGTTISSYEQGNKSPTLENAVKLAHALGCSLDWLCGIEPAVKEQDKDTFAFKLNELADLASLQCCQVFEDADGDGDPLAIFQFDAPEIVEFVSTLKALQTLSGSGLPKDILENMKRLAVDGFAEKYKYFIIDENGRIDGLSNNLPDDLPF